MNNEKDNYVVSEVLSIWIPISYDSTFQTLPHYDPTEKMLVVWEDETPEYFLNFFKLPNGWQDPHIWIDGFLRELEASAEDRYVNVTNRGIFYRMVVLKSHI